MLCRMSDRTVRSPAGNGERTRLFSAIAAAAAILGLAAIPPASPEEMLRRADAPRNAFAEAVIAVHLTVTEGGRPVSTADFDLYVKNPDRSLVVFRGGKQSGRKILTVGDRVWLLVPGASHPIPVTANQRLMGGASFGDVARLRFADAFSATLRPGEERVGEVLCRVLDLKARSSTASYATGVLWVGRDDGLARRLVLSLPSGKPAKEALFRQYAREAGRILLQKMEIRDLLSPERDLATMIEYRDYRRAHLDPRMFEPEGALAF
jgi:Outer membrane lipoprotein-sorting protein